MQRKNVPLCEIMTKSVWWGGEGGDKKPKVPYYDTFFFEGLSYHAMLQRCSPLEYFKTWEVRVEIPQLSEINK